MNKDKIILDVRTKEEYDSGHIKDAINMDFYNSDFEEKISKLNKSKNYFIYCRSGGRSSEVLEIMKDMDFKNITELKGGIMSHPELISK